MKKKNDIFISYRREGGEHFAQLLFTQLSHDGYHPFFDVESMRSGKFNEQIYDHIDKCSTVILVLPQGALDRCCANDDWVRLEISYALKTKKKIIPLMMRGFEWPDKLPDDIDDVRNYHGISVADMSLYSGVYSKLLDLLNQSSPSGSKQESSSPKRFRAIRPFLGHIDLFLFGMLSALCAHVLLLFYFFSNYAMQHDFGNFLFLNISKAIAAIAHYSLAKTLTLWAFLSFLGAALCRRACYNYDRRKLEILHDAGGEAPSIIDFLDFNIALDDLDLTVDSFQQAMFDRSIDFPILEPIGTDNHNHKYRADVRNGRLSLFSFDNERCINRLHFRFFAKRLTDGVSILQLYAGCPQKNAIAILINQGLSYRKESHNIHYFTFGDYHIVLRCNLGVVQEIEISKLNDDLSIRQKPNHFRNNCLDFLCRNLAFPTKAFVFSIIFQIVGLLVILSIKCLAQSKGLL